MLQGLMPISLVSLVVLAGCGSTAGGKFHSDSGALGTWTFKPSRCTSGATHGLVAADLFSTESAQDTEVVAVALATTQGVVLVRVPTRDRMVMLRASSCETFHVDLHPEGTAVGGSVRLDCALPDGGHFAGNARFFCF
jgi:hypothetical protein